MEKFSKYIFDFSEIDTKEISELPLAIKFGTSEKYQPIIDKARNGLADIMSVALEVKSDFPVCDDIYKLTSEQLESLRAITSMDQDESEKLVKNICQNLKLTKNRLRLIVEDASNESMIVNTALAHSTLDKAFKAVTCAKTNKEVLELGNSAQSRNLINSTIKLAAKAAMIDQYAIKEGSVLRNAMNGDDIRFANLVLSSLASRLNGQIIPSDKKVGILEAARKELKEIISDDVGSIDLVSEDICKETLSANYKDAVRVSEQIQREVPKLIGLLKLVQMPPDMIYDTQINRHALDAIQTLKVIENNAHVVANRADHIHGVKDNIGDLFRENEIDFDSDFKAFDPDETDWYTKYIDEDSDLLDEIQMLSESVEYDQRELEESLSTISNYLDTHLRNEIKLSTSALEKEISAHKSAIKNNDYSM